MQKQGLGWLGLCLGLAGCGGASAAPECGAGTYSSGGECLSAALLCGEGTVFKDGECVAPSTPAMDGGAGATSGGAGLEGGAPQGVGGGEESMGGTGAPESMGGASEPDDHPTCGPGTTLQNQQCLPDGTGSVLACGDGTEQVGDECVASVSIDCGPGTKLVGEQCLPEGSPVVCGTGTQLANGECVPLDEVTCGTGTMLVGDQCVPASTVTCGDGTKLEGDVCVPTQVSCGPGTLLEGATCVIKDAPQIPTSETFSFHIAEKGAHTVYFLDEAGTKVHRFDLAKQAFLAPLGTSQLTAKTMSVTPNGDVVYLGNVGGRIDALDPSTGALTFLGAGPSTLIWMTVTGSFLYTIDDSGAWESHATFNLQTGERVFSDDWRNASYGAYYAPGLNRVFTFRDGTSPNDIYYEEVDQSTGALSTDVESPYHGDYALGHPIRVSPDETTVYVASGVAFKTTDLTYKNSIGIGYTDLAFGAGRLYLLHAGNAGSEVVVLDDKYVMLSSFQLAGTPLRLFVDGGKLTVFTRQAGAIVTSQTSL